MRNGIVYAIKNGAGLIKIGCSSNIESRLSTLKTGDITIKLIYKSNDVSNKFEVENQCHKSLSANRVGGEWFNISNELAISTIKEKISSHGKDPVGFEQSDLKAEIMLASFVQTGITVGFMAENNQDIIFDYLSIISTAKYDTYRGSFLDKTDSEKYLEASEFFAKCCLSNMKSNSEDHENKINTRL